MASANDDSLSLVMTLIGAQIVDGDAGLVEILKTYSLRDLAITTLFLTTWITEHLRQQSEELDLPLTETWQFIARHLLAISTEHGEQ